MSMVLRQQLIASKLNLANGSDPSPVINTINDADALLSHFSGKLPYRVRRSTPAGRAMLRDATVLRDYNKRILTPGCCE